MIMIRAYFRSINQSVSFVLSVLNMPIHSIFTNTPFMQYVWYMVSYLFDTFDFITCFHIIPKHSGFSFDTYLITRNITTLHKKHDTTFCPTFRCAKSEARSSYHLVYLAYAKWGLWLVVPNPVIKKSGWHYTQSNCVMPKVTLSMLSKTVASSMVRPLFVETPLPGVPGAQATNSGEKTQNWKWCWPI